MGRATGTCYSSALLAGAGAGRMPVPVPGACRPLGSAQGQRSTHGSTAQRCVMQ